MKKLLLSLTLVITITATSNAMNASNENQSSIVTKNINAEPDGWGKWLLQAVKTLIGGSDGGGIDVQKGTNKVINDVRYECIDGGICRVRTGGAAKAQNTSLSALKAGQNALLQDANGLFALIITKEEARANSDFNLTEGYYMIPETFNFSSDSSMPAEFRNLSVKGKVKYDLEELPNHYAIILNK